MGNKTPEPEKGIAEELRESLRPEDFDGHTEFARMTPSQRLDWLANAQRFILEYKGIVARQASPRPKDAS